MPYPNQDFRDEVEATTDLEHDASYFASLSEQDFAGALNFWIHYVCRKFILRKGIKYWRLALVVGTLLLTILELVRRIVNPYEDKKIKDVGDVDVHEDDPYFKPRVERM